MVDKPERNRGPKGPRIDSIMHAVTREAIAPEQVLDSSTWYAYAHQLIA